MLKFQRAREEIQVLDLPEERLMKPNILESPLRGCGRPSSLIDGERCPYEAIVMQKQKDSSRTTDLDERLELAVMTPIDDQMDGDCHIDRFC